MRWWPLLLLLSCDSNSPPLCASEVPSQRAPQTDELIAWTDSAGCIEIAYTPTLRDRETLLIEAVGAWINNPCRLTCFAAPVERALPDSGIPNSRTIHFTDKASGAPRTVTRNSLRPDTGELSRSVVEVDPTLIDPLFTRAVLLGFGRALGFDTPTSSVASTLQTLLTDGLEAPSDEDEKAFCGKYGSCS